VNEKTDKVNEIKINTEKPNDNQNTQLDSEEIKKETEKREREKNLKLVGEEKKIIRG